MQITSPALDLPCPIRLGLGPGSGPRLLSTGVPDAWLPFGGGLAILDAQGVVWLQGQEALWIPTPGAPVSCVPWGSEHLGVLADGAEGLIWFALGRRPLDCASVDSLGWLPVGERLMAAPLPDGTVEFPWVPDGACDALQAPLWGRAGLAWMASGTIYRGHPRKPKVAGSIDFEALHAHPGPGGTLLLVGEERMALVPPSCPPTEFECSLVEGGFRFVQDGRGLLARTEEGLAHFSAQTGQATVSTPSRICPDF